MIELLFAFQLAAGGGADQTVDTSRAKQWATDTAMVAGGAKFCELDPEILEIYITSAQAKIASVATDDVDLVVAKVEFSHVFSVAVSRAPLGGCANFGKLFAHESAKLD